MNPKFKKRIRQFIVVLTSIYFAGGVALYFIQDLILFHPRPLAKDHKFLFNQPFEELNIPFEKNNLSIIKFKPVNERKGIVLFFHGNMENVEHYKKYPSLFTRNGFEIWMIDYPGFGKSTGKRTEKLIDEETLLMYGLASQEIKSDSIIIYGKSIGTGVACYLAANRNCRQLILETPYYSIDALAKHFFPIYPVKQMINYSFPIHIYLKKITASIIIFHGTEDEVVPYRQGKQLAQENKIELITIEKGKHNNLFGFNLYQKKMDSLLY